MKQVSNANFAVIKTAKRVRLYEDLSYGIRLKQEPKDLSMKPDIKMQRFPANLIINPIASAFLMHLKLLATANSKYRRIEESAVSFFTF